MFCPECGKQIEDYALFCPECGTKIEQQPQQPAANEAPTTGTEAGNTFGNTTGTFKGMSKSAYATFRNGTASNLGLSNCKFTEVVQTNA